MAASGLTLLFLSRGYFASKACAIEYRAACQLQKPMVLVHEADENHGGAPLDDLRKQCDAPKRTLRSRTLPPRAGID